MEIIGNVKSYEWGKLGSNSAVAQLAILNNAGFELKTDNSYAELWMGDHPSGPSFIKKSNVELKTVLPKSLPFLFKVLSIRKALSIQVHPNKKEAERLHKERPDIYKDPNHKPELAIALTPFLALCGFRPYSEIHQICQDLPPLATLMGDKIDNLKNGSGEDLRNCYERLMTSKNEETAECIKKIGQNYMEVLNKYGLDKVFTVVNKDFPDDVGILSIFFLNLLHLQPGQAIFLAANEIHAYLAGDCIECMACSDNVIRAGLTPKYKDVNQLISCLNYAGSPAQNKIFQPHQIDGFLKMFVPPVEDFAVMQLVLPSKVKNYVLQVQPCGSILLVLQGERTLHVRYMPSKRGSDIVVKRGSIIYIPPEAAPEIEFTMSNQSEEDFVAYIATENRFLS